MKNLLKRLLPERFLQWYRLYLKPSKYRHRSAKAVFTEIYHNNRWRSSESISGTGSEIQQTESLIPALDKLLADMEITSVLDLPCGDFNWMQKVNLRKVDYVGADIVEELIANNTRQYGHSNLQFIVLDLLADALPKTDLIIARDCLVHFSFEDAGKAIKNIKASGSKYLLATTFTDCRLNQDIVTGHWRPLNLQEKPFCFPAPLQTINENCTEDNGRYKDKSLALWDIADIAA